MSISPETLEALEAQVLKLPADEREHLLESLVVSLVADPEVEKAWEEEIERRDAELRAGTAQVVPLEDALARLRTRHYLFSPSTPRRPYSRC